MKASIRIGGKCVYHWTLLLLCPFSFCVCVSRQPTEHGEGLSWGLLEVSSTCGVFSPTTAASCCIGGISWCLLLVQSALRRLWVCVDSRKCILLILSVRFTPCTQTVFLAGYTVWPLLWRCVPSALCVDDSVVSFSPQRHSVPQRVGLSRPLLRKSIQRRQLWSVHPLVHPLHPSGLHLLVPACLQGLQVHLCGHVLCPLGFKFYAFMPLLPYRNCVSYSSTAGGDTTLFSVWVTSHDAAFLTLRTTK